MINYTLTCERGHSFDSWFASSAAYEKQKKRGLVACPECGSSRVDKGIMSPNIGSASGDKRDEARAPEAPKVAMLSPQEQEIRGKLRELRDHLTANAENVGDKFPNEARKMHYGDIEHRSIYGNATTEEAKALLDEGVELHPLPVLPDDKN